MPLSTPRVAQHDIWTWRRRTDHWAKSRITYILRITQWSCYLPKTAEVLNVASAASISLCPDSVGCVNYIVREQSISWLSIQVPSVD